jgi:hypothetical protein
MQHVGGNLWFSETDLKTKQPCYIILRAKCVNVLRSINSDDSATIIALIYYYYYYYKYYYN